MSLSPDSAKHGWWEEYADAVTPGYAKFVGLEAAASSCRNWQSDVVPGLLQTAAYARQLDAAYRTINPTISAAVQERFLRVRQIRQQRLSQDPVLRLFSIMDEAVLLRGIGDRGIMRDQLATLVEVAALPNVDLRILPLERDVALGGVPSFTIMSSGQSDGETFPGDVVNTESLNAELYVEGDASTALFRSFFGALTDAALTPSDSRDLIVTTMKRVWS
jgi:hypothetical protein